MVMPAALTARLKDDALHRDVQIEHGLHLRVPVAGDPLDLERLVRRVTEGRWAEQRRLA
jgi:hypothetical protein